MKIGKKLHKLVLFELFFEKKQHQMTGQEMVVPKEFPLEKLMNAGCAKAKLMGEVSEGGNTVSFNDTEVEFTPGEVVVLKELFDAKKSWAVDKAETVLELKDIFNPPKPLPAENV